MFMICGICNHNEPDLKKFSNHLNSSHGIKSKDYTKDILKVNFLCCVCGKETRYVAFTFKKYCKEHSRVAESEAGKLGGKIKKTWNSGKTRETDNRVNLLAEKTSGSANHFFGKKHALSTKERMKVVKSDSLEKYQSTIVKFNVENHHVISTYEQYVSQSFRNMKNITFECKDCGSFFTRQYYQLNRGIVCRKCNPISKPQIEIAEFVSSLGFRVIQNDRQIIKPLEIDIVVPEKNLGIEHNGIYWHMTRPRGYHFNKFRIALESGIKLIQIFSDEWLEKREIVESIIRHKLGKSNKRQHARDLEVSAMSCDESKEFFEANHIGGYARSHSTYCLKLGNDVLAALSLRKPLQKKYNGYQEIARFCTAINYSIPGALSKLISIVRKNHGSKLISYADLRFGNGEGYETLGFKPIGYTGESYWYTDGYMRFGRALFKANHEKTEKQLVADAGVAKICSPGNRIFVLE